MSWPGTVCVCGRINRLLNPEPGEKLWKFPAEVQSGPAARAALAGREAPGGREAVQPSEPPWLLQAWVGIAGQQNSPTPPPEPPQVGWEQARLKQPPGPPAAPAAPAPPAAAADLALQAGICKQKRYLLLGFFFLFFFLKESCEVLSRERWKQDLRNC